MAQRKRIGILFQYDESWAGGLYYLLNIINALHFLPDEKKPVLVVFHKSESVKSVIGATYPYVEYYPLYKSWTLVDRIIGKVLRIIGVKNYLPQYDVDLADFVFPCDYKFDHTYNSFKRIKKVYWIPDFQHKRLPHFFDKEELEARDAEFQKIAEIQASLVLSSLDAAKDFKEFYPNSKSSLEILPFATILPDFSGLDADAVIEKHRLTRPYFISPNQFWAHKNHMIVLKAISLLKKKGYVFKVGFTGKETDYRNSEYIHRLKSYIEQEGLQSHVVFLGFIDRLEQLALMKSALAIVQPSLFEGWSTVVEDAKAMNQNLILSNLLVHIEQCGEVATYFNPHDDYELAQKMEGMLQEPPAQLFYDYSEDIKKYAERILNLG